MIEGWELGLLLVTGLVAGFVDTLAGGGGLLTLPVLLTICPDPIIALGTNKLQASFGSSSATFHFARAGALSARDCWRACLLAFLGSLAGSTTELNRLSVTIKGSVIYPVAINDVISSKRSGKRKCTIIY